jgi:hypothetical protein
MNLEEIEPILEEILQKSLREKKYPFGFAKKRGLGDKVASGKLVNSVQVVTKSNRQGDTVLQVLMEPYAQWVQSGRLPGKKGVPVDVLEKWISDRKLMGRDAKGRFIKKRSFAFAIQQNIKKFGIRPANFIDNALEMIGNDDRILEIIGEDSYNKLIDLIEGL